MTYSLGRSFSWFNIQFEKIVFVNGLEIKGSTDSPAENIFWDNVAGARNKAYLYQIIQASNEW